MKNQFRSLFVLMALVAVLVSACGPEAAVDETSSGGDKPRAALVEFTGVIESIDGNQWIVNGQSITVDDTILRDGPFQVGDTVKVEAEVQADGSVVVTRVELPALPATQDPNANANDNSNSSLDNANSNTNDSSLNGGINSNDDNSNGDDHGGLGNSNGDDDNSNGSISNSNDDDHGGNSNSNGDDDNSGKGGGDDD